MTDRTPIPQRIARRVLLVTAAFVTAFAALETVWGQGDSPAWRERALSQLEEILRRPEFQWQEEQPSLLERIWEWFTQQLINMLPNEAPGGRIVTVLLVIAGVLAIGVILYFVIRRLRREIAPDIEPGAAGVDGEPQDASLAMDRARDLSKIGDYRQALRYLYLSTLLLLEERGLIRYDRSRTNLEYLQSIGDHPQLATHLREIIHIFERSWYGLQIPDAQTYDRFERQVQSIRELT